MRRIKLSAIIILMLLFSALPLRAQKISGFKENIFMEEKGSARIVWSFTASGDSSELLFPWNFKEKPEAKINFTLLSLPDNKQVSPEPVLVERNGSLFVSVFISNKAEGNYNLEFEVKDFQSLGKEKAEEFGNYLIKYRFINTALPNIKDFESRIYLPKGFVIVSVDETIPKQTEDNPVSPFTLGTAEGRNYITVKAAQMKLGEHAFVKMNIRSEEKPLTTLIIFAAAGLLYLFFFRELVSKKNGNGNSENNNNA